ncbi:MAG: DUF535 family protein [Gemmatimonadaceae bacterium]
MSKSTGMASVQIWRRSMDAYKNESTKKRIERSIKWSALSLAHPLATREWLTYLESSAMSRFDQANPLLVFKPFRPYLSSAWRFKHRVKVLKDTYDFAHSHFNILGQALINPTGKELLRFDLPNYGTIVANLGFDNRYRKEGEFRLLLTARNEIDSFALSFAFESDDRGDVSCCIGCIQGKEGSKEAFKELTKELHGLRPRSLLIFILQEVARVLGVRELLAPGESIQVRRAQHLIHLSKLHSLEFDYDSLWLELGGQVLTNGWYRLPLETARRSSGQIASKKRAQYARRYSLMDDMIVQLRSNMRANIPAHLLI